ncbi:hypothetical protein RAS1_15320 [Phycisphaerae bacterium RAS1]|nr:hypothetical protein RAS1_15320 [Phycisphaerae bacterium RAS1]
MRLSRNLPGIRAARVSERRFKSRSLAVAALNGFRDGLMSTRMAVLTVLAFSAAGLTARAEDKPASAPAATQPAADFSGAWETAQSRLWLSQRGAAVVGHDDQNNLIEGAVEGRKLRFSVGGGLPVGGIITLSEDGQSFSGELSSPLSDLPALALSGRRPLAARGPMTFDGLWQTKYGRMRLRTDGQKITGIYEYAGISKINGTLSGERFEFKYDQADGEKGEGVFELTTDGRAFTGTWKTETGRGGAWAGVRVEPEPGVSWLFVVEAPWEESVLSPPYSYGDMLRSFFTRDPKVRVRQRFFHDVPDLRRWCAEVPFFAEPVVLYISSHGTEQGVIVGNRMIPTKTIADCVKEADNLALLHFGACQVLAGEDTARVFAEVIPTRRFPISGFGVPVDWAGSAIVDFTYLDLMLSRGLPAAAAVEQTKQMISFARPESGGAIPGADLRLLDAGAKSGDGK